MSRQSTEIEREIYRISKIQVPNRSHYHRRILELKLEKSVLEEEKSEEYIEQMRYKTFLASIPSVWEWEEII